VAPFDKPELHVIRFPPEAGAEWRAQREEARRQARRRYVEHLSPLLPAERAMAVLAALTEWDDVNSGEPCHCGCHPRLPESDLHDFGFGCPCRKTVEERRRSWEELWARQDAYRASPEGQREVAAREAEERAVEAWLAQHPGVEVRSYGGFAPEQWRGSVDGHSFYFRERHGEWRIELDLRPTGRFSRVWVGGDLDDDSSFEPREIEEGDVVAEGTVGAAGYGDSPVSRLRFIVRAIRAHLGREACTVHTADRAAVEAALGRPLAWCPACGADLNPPPQPP
jgi:hypothetical protein